MTPQRIGRLTRALLGLAAAVLVSLLVPGLLVLVVVVLVTEPWSRGRMVSAAFIAAGLALLVVFSLLDPHGMSRLLAKARRRGSELLATVASGGRR
jgi:hypothetical protein